MIDTKGLVPGAVLAALYNASKPLGLGMIHYDNKAMTPAEGQALLGDDNRSDDMGFKVASVHKTSRYFDYLKGRVMKVNLEDPSGFEEWLYDRDNGTGAAQRAIDALKLK